MTTAIILAGGLGTRLRGLVPDLPKPMAPIDGRPFLEHQIDYWYRQGVRRFILSVGYRREAIIDYFGRRYREAQIDYAVEERPLGTGGGLRLALDRLPDDPRPVLVLNGDTFFDVRLRALQAFYTASSAQWVCALFRAAEPSRYMGVTLEENGRIIELKSVVQDIGALANGGVYYLDPSAVIEAGFRSGDCFSLENDLLPRLHNRGPGVFGMECSGRFVDIGVPADYLGAARILKESVP